MKVTYYFHAVNLVVADDIANMLRENGIPVDVEDKTPVQKLMHIEVPDEVTFDDMLALGSLIGGEESRLMLNH